MQVTDQPILREKRALHLPLLRVDVRALEHRGGASDAICALCEYLISKHVHTVCVNI
jgi:hypothetical protein